LLSIRPTLPASAKADSVDVSPGFCTGLGENLYFFSLFIFSLLFLPIYLFHCCSSKSLSYCPDSNSVCMRFRNFPPLRFTSFVCCTQFFFFFKCSVPKQIYFCPNRHQESYIRILVSCIPRIVDKDLYPHRIKDVC
jgi:hypothetical protein